MAMESVIFDWKSIDSLYSQKQVNNLNFIIFWLIHIWRVHRSDSVKNKHSISSLSDMQLFLSDNQSKSYLFVKIMTDFSLFYQSLLPIFKYRDNFQKTSVVNRTTPTVSKMTSSITNSSPIVHGEKKLLY